MLTSKASKERALLLRADGTEFKMGLSGLTGGAIATEDLLRPQHIVMLLVLEGHCDLVRLGEDNNPEASSWRHSRAVGRQREIDKATLM